MAAAWPPVVAHSVEGGRAQRREESGAGGWRQRPSRTVAVARSTRSSSSSASLVIGSRPVSCSNVCKQRVWRAGGWEGGERNRSQLGCFLSHLEHFEDQALLVQVPGLLGDHRLLRHGARDCRTRRWSWAGAQRSAPSLASPPNAGAHHPAPHLRTAWCLRCPGCLLRSQPAPCRSLLQPPIAMKDRVGLCARKER